MRPFSVLVLVLAALGFLGFGAWLLVDPVGGLAGVGIAGTTAAGVVELRAFYGGLEIGLGLFLLLCSARPDWRVPGLWLVLLGNLCIGLTRLYGIGDSGEFNNFFAAALAWEFGFPVLATIALMGSRRR
ncbi:MAG: hypothetical protein A3E01_03865 [Gammaproteobacteria bacterium RIFCSPHIGHO2_12_FULL_63_22]|nr:MAG: hypothetical protein A3E01_03865 [Gammaproteobacteria bacterium RIFCSPHIGHO2_12_FULL_63_22]